MNLCAKKIPFVNLVSLAVCLAALTASAQTAATFGNLPLYFEAGSAGQFLARGSDAEFHISPTETQFALRKPDSTRAVQMQFAGANPLAQISGDSEFSGKINYLTGDNPAQWRSGISTFAKVRVAGIYPGVNLVYYGNQRRLEYDFTIAPGANPKVIAICFNGANKISINADGDLILKLGDSEILQPKPKIYQLVNGMRKEVGGGYKMLDARTIAFSVENYDRSLPLVIDPVLSYATYFGGTSGETAWAIALSPNDGSIYVAGQTFSKIAFTNAVPMSVFSTNNTFSTPASFQTNFAGGKSTGDAFVAKFDNSGKNLLYLTYLGGSADDAAYGVAVDNLGDAFVTGFTQSSNFPTANAIYPQISGPFYKDFKSYASDAFVAELNPSGSNLIYSTYLGGESSEAAYGIAVDALGNAYVTGFTYSTNFPTVNAVQDRLACTNSIYFNANAFVTEIATNGSSVVFSTYLGGTNFDTGKGIAVDASGIYVTGFTASTNFPTTNYISQTIGANFYNGHLLNGSTNKTKLNFASDAFVTKFAPGGGSFIYSTYLGGTNNDVANSIAVDGSGAAYVTGWTISTNYPNTIGTNIIASHLTNNLRGFIVTTNVFLTKITNGISAGIAYSVVFGGNNDDVGNGVAVDPSGNAFVVGSTTSTNFPFIPTNSIGFLHATNFGGNDVFVTAFNSSAAPLYSVLLGGKKNDFGYGIAVDSMTNAFIVGQTASTNFATSDAFQNFRNGTNDAFLAELLFVPMPPQITMQPTNQLRVETGYETTFSVTATGTPVLGYHWRFNGTNLMDGTNFYGATVNGSTNVTLTIDNAQTNDSGNYSVIITNYGGSVTSDIVMLSVTSVPFFTLQPMDQTVGLGSTVMFSIDGQTAWDASTESFYPYGLQWFKDGTNLVDGTNAAGSVVSGSMSANLYIENAQISDGGTYWCVFTNDWGLAASSNAALAVLIAPQFTSTVSMGANGFVFSGNGGLIGGTNSGTYRVLASTNLLTPFNLWSPVETNQFGNQGQFIFTNFAPTNSPQQFYILQSP